MRFNYELTPPLGHNATLGLIVLQADETLEHDMRRLLPLDGVALYVTRVPSGAEVTPETLNQMAGHMTGAAALFPPLRFDTVGYGCTSGTSVIGANRVSELVRDGCKTQAVTEPVSALIAACQHLGVRKLAFLSPYVEDVNDRLRGALRDQGGIDTPFFGSFYEEREENVAKIAPESLIAAAETLGHDPNCEAIFMSCTNLRTLDVIDEIEKRTGKPVLSSNLVLAWHMAQQAGIALASRYGRLTS